MGCSGIPVGLGEDLIRTMIKFLPLEFFGKSYSSENSHTLIGYLDEVFSVELRLLKASLCVILHWSDNKTTIQKQKQWDIKSCFQNHCRRPRSQKQTEVMSKVEVSWK